MPYPEQHLGTTRQNSAVTKFITSSLMKTTAQNQHTHAAPLTPRQSLDAEKLFVLNESVSRSSG